MSSWYTDTHSATQSRTHGDSVQQHTASSTINHEKQRVWLGEARGSSGLADEIWRKLCHILSFLQQILFSLSLSLLKMHVILLGINSSRDLNYTFVIIGN